MRMLLFFDGVLQLMLHGSDRAKKVPRVAPLTYATVVIMLRKAAALLC